jgi:parvulin-like peptidyl-prolyl isomerase
MVNSTNITPQELLKEVKLSLQLPILREQIIEHQIIAQTVAAAGLKPQPEDIQKAANQIRMNHDLLGATETYAWLEKYDLSLDDLEELAWRECLKQQLMNHLFADKIESYFVQHQLDYMSAVLYEVVFEDEELAYEQYCALQAGETTFPQVAHQYIQDLEKRRVGGYLGVKRRKELRPEISAIVFMANPPQVLKPVILENGIYLLLVEEIIQIELNPDFELEIKHRFFSEWKHRKKRQ